MNDAIKMMDAILYYSVGRAIVRWNHVVSGMVDAIYGLENDYQPITDDALTCLRKQHDSDIIRRFVRVAGEKNLTLRRWKRENFESILRAGLDARNHFAHSGFAVDPERKIRRDYIDKRTGRKFVSDEMTIKDLEALLMDIEKACDLIYAFSIEKNYPPRSPSIKP